LDSPPSALNTRHARTTGASRPARRMQRARVRPLRPGQVARQALPGPRAGEVAPRRLGDPRLARRAAGDGDLQPQDLEAEIPIRRAPAARAPRRTRVLAERIRAVSARRPTRAARDFR